MKIKRIGRMISCFLLTEGSAAILIDTGNAAMRSAVENGISGYNVQLVLLTHGHRDHTGNAAYLQRHMRVPVAMHPADCVLIDNPNARKLYTAGVMGRVMKFSADRLEAGEPFEPFVPDIRLEEGMSLLPYGMDAQTVALPGHTLGSIGVLTKERVLLAGDAMMHLGLGQMPALYEDREMTELSLRKIRSTGAKIVYVSHGSPVRL